MRTFFGQCFVRLQAEPFVPFFGFAEFIAALALIAVVFTISDIRYKFRISVAPIPLIPITFWVTAFIGIAAIYSDVAFSLGWEMPRVLSSHALWQGFLGTVFLLLILVWMFFAFLRPPVFGRLNAKRYVQTLYRVIVTGDPDDMAIVGQELARSAKSIVRTFPDQNVRRRWKASDKSKKYSRSARYAHDLLLLIGTRRFCRSIVASAPGTAILFFHEMTEAKKYNLPITQFSMNISTEAIQNKDSMLFHEDDGYSSGLIGYLKPFSAAIYGNYELVEALGANNGSPLDVDYRAYRSWDAKQFEAFTRATLTTFKSYLARQRYFEHSYVLTRAIGIIKNVIADTYKLNDTSEEESSSDIYVRLRVAVDFLGDVVDAIGKCDPMPRPVKLKYKSGQQMPGDFYDRLAGLGFEIISAASYVRRPSGLSWSVQYGVVWSNIFGLTSQSKAWPIIQYKIRRRLYEEITRFDFLNYLSSRILAMVLNAGGFGALRKTGFDRPEYPLEKAITEWTRKNLLPIWRKNPDVVEWGFPASIELDVANKRLVKTFAKGLEREPSRAFLALDDNEPTKPMVTLVGMNTEPKA